MATEARDRIDNNIRKIRIATALAAGGVLCTGGAALAPASHNSPAPAG